MRKLRGVDGEFEKSGKTVILTNCYLQRLTIIDLKEWMMKTVFL